MLFSELLNYSESDFYQDINKNYEVINNIKSKLIPENLKIYFYRIEFIYKTFNGDEKSNVKYVISDNVLDAKFKFLEYIIQYNKQSQFCKYLEVMIVKCVEEGNIKLLIN